MISREVCQSGQERDQKLRKWPSAKGRARKDESPEGGGDEQVSASVPDNYHDNTITRGR